MKKVLNWRIFISLGLVTSFMMLLVSGIVLFIAPPGRVANWTGWQLLALSKSEWQDQHTIFGFTFALLSVFHLFVINWKAFVSYIKAKATSGLSHPLELVSILLLTILFGVGTAQHMQPFSAITTLGEQLKGSWESSIRQPPVAHAETMTLEELAQQPSVGKSAEEILETLQKAGLKASSTSETLGEIARKSGISAEQAYQLLAPANKELQKEGFGRKTLLEVAEENGVSAASLQLALEAKGMKAEPSDSMRSIAESNGISVQELRQRVEEILR
ncbi:MAG: hypothetical protein A3K90_08330 [Pelodictyon luteolum]|uniref:Flavinylation-associated cytochrome domain-containing protein n=1 Tax=Pelodictyon luteolum TaxID=1100 RepID=A0A165L627_PELLU|nr:DUF4405 domain-containing protein [Pelodictyon luteolum]KZK73613.1 MAG: hypothetical protein A3K90_08330 [Pelodictyon luteolum]